jgi:hypothetical protein
MERNGIVQMEQARVRLIAARATLRRMILRQRARPAPETNLIFGPRRGLGLAAEVPRWRNLPIRSGGVFNYNDSKEHGYQNASK